MPSDTSQAESCVSPPRVLVQTKGEPLSHWIARGVPYSVKRSSRTRRTDSPRLLGINLAARTNRGKPPDASETRHLAAYHQGFSLHAGVHLHPNDRQGLAHLCGYGARPPLTQERLSALPDGKLAYRMKRRLGDGRDVLILEPRELLRRL